MGIDFLVRWKNIYQRVKVHFRLLTKDVAVSLMLDIIHLAQRLNLNQVSRVGNV